MKININLLFQLQYRYEMQRPVQQRDGRRDRMGYNMYTSEPDLRYTEGRPHPPMGYQHHHNGGDNGVVKGRMSRSKKKYRAPQIPPPPSSFHHNGVSTRL